MDDDVESYLQGEYGKSLDDLDADEAMAILGDFDGVVEGIVKIASKPKKAPKGKKAATMPD